MGDGEDGGIQRYGDTTLLGIDKGLTGCKTQGDTQLGSGHILDKRILFAPNTQRGTVVAPILQDACRLVVAVAGKGFDGETGVHLQFVGQRSIAQIGHLVDGSPLPAYEKVVLISLQILVAGRHYIIGIAEAQIMLRKLPQHIVALVEGVGCLAGVEPLLILGTVGSIAAETPVGVEVAGSHTTETKTGSVDVVAGHDGIDRTDIELAGMLLGTCLHKVLNQCLGTEDDILEARYLLDAVHEDIHRALLLGERYLANLGPILVALGQHVGLLDDTTLQTEKAGFYLVKLIVAVFGCTLHFQSLNTLHEVKFHGHIVIRQHPVAVRQLGEFLYDIKIFHKVDTCLLRQIHGTFADGIGRVLDHVEVAGEAKVLRILRDECQVDTLLLIHHEGIHQIVFVERDGPFADGADKTTLQQTDIVVVDIHVGKDIVQDGAQHITRTEKLLDTRGVHTFDDGLFAFGILAIDGFRSRLFDGDGENGLVGFGRDFHLILEEGELLVDAFLHLVRSDIVDGHLHLLVLLVLIVVVLLQLQCPLAGNHLLHELHSWIVLA